MHNYQFEFGLQTVVRINKAKARNLYDAGKTIIMYMIHDNPESPYIHGLVIKKEMRLLAGRAFDAWVNEYEYNRSCYGRGKYAKFFAFVREEEDEIE